MRGSMCNCGFATVADRAACPRCGKPTLPAEWGDEGRVLSYCRLESAPDRHREPSGLALVEIDGRGPKVACWSPDRLSVGDLVEVTKGSAGTYTCTKL